MSLLMASLVLSLGIGFFCMLPFQFKVVRNYSKPVLFVGSLVLVGFCAFDLVPEMIEMGGMLSLALMGASWAVFAGIHALQSKGHDHAHASKAHHNHDHAHSAAFLLGSMALHCFAGGMLLVSSYAISERLAYHVFLGLVTHKAFEAVAVSSLLIEKIHSRGQLIAYAAIYALSFPAGVLVTAWGKSVFEGTLGTQGIETAAMVITSLAVGNLFGCLLQDFLIPSIQQFRARASKLQSA